jgi:hypothetical protein
MAAEGNKVGILLLNVPQPEAGERKGLACFARTLEEAGGER